MRYTQPIKAVGITRCHSTKGEQGVERGVEQGVEQGVERGVGCACAHVLHSLCRVRGQGGGRGGGNRRRRQRPGRRRHATGVGGVQAGGRARDEHAARDKGLGVA